LNLWISVVGPPAGALVGVAISEALHRPADAQLPFILEQAPEAKSRPSDVAGAG